MIICVCKTCGELKRPADFYRRRNGHRDETCKDCWRLRGRERYVPKAKRVPSENGVRPTVLFDLQRWCVRA